MIAFHVLSSIQEQEEQSETLQNLKYCQEEKAMKDVDFCLKLMLNNTVFVNAMSSNHFTESRNMVGSILQQMPGAHIIIYDLGLLSEQVAEIGTMCGVELRAFNFNAYPAHVTSKNLLNYAWKPLIIKEISLEYEIVVWVDTSVRFKASLKLHIFPYFLSTNFTYVGPPLLRLSHVQFAHDGIIAYFNLSREELKGLPIIEANFGVFWMTNPVTKLLDDWVDCAMNKECIEPKGALRWGIDRTRGNCRHRLLNVPDPAYIDCFLFDQTALDLILYKYYGRGLAKVVGPVVGRTCTIKREDRSRTYTIPQCHNTTL